MRKNCTVCQESKPLEEFHLNGLNKWRGDCKSCVRDKQRRYSAQHPEQERSRAAAWRRANPERFRALNRAWRERHPEYPRQQYEKHKGRFGFYARLYKARKRGATVEPFSRSDWDKVVVLYGGRCAYCGCNAWEEMEHMVPLARGGFHEIGNVVPACGDCNHRKHLMTAMEFLVSRVKRATG